MLFFNYPFKHSLFAALFRFHLDEPGVLLSERRICLPENENKKKIIWPARDFHRKGSVGILFLIQKKVILISQAAVAQLVEH